MNLSAVKMLLDEHMCCIQGSEVSTVVQKIFADSNYGSLQDEVYYRQHSQLAQILGCN